jgi:catechol 2,3-dioxygenase-like lactoylglutathione lyase family enzyme
MPNDLHHVAVFVDDLDRAVHLFRNFFAFEVAWRLPRVGGSGLCDVLGVPGVEAEIVYLRTGSGGTALELVHIIGASPEEEPAGKRASARVILSLNVEDLDGLHQRLSEDGWTPFTQAVRLVSPDGHPIKMFCFQVENGFTLELIQPATNAAD